MADLRTVWYVRSRQVGQTLRFWLALFGIDTNDRTLNHSIYIVYVIIFFSIWGFAVLSLFANTAAQILESLAPGKAELAAAVLSALAGILWILSSLIYNARRSPLRFSEEDSFIVCQTPLDRSAVTLNWFAGDAPAAGLPFWIGSTIIGFALADIQTNNAGFTALSYYIIAGLRAISIVLVFQIGLLACLWAFGLLRLQQNRPRPVWFGWVFPTVALFGLAAAVIAFQQGWDGLNSGTGRIAAWVLLFPLQAAYGPLPWQGGFLISLLWVFVGVSLLYLAGKQVSLTRAALETSQQTSQQTILLAGEMDIAADMSVRNRLGEAHLPTTLMSYPGFGMLWWKDLLQSWRALSFNTIFAWGGMLASMLAVLLVSDLAARSLIAIYTIGQLGKLLTRRLRSDLSHWWLLQSLPFDRSRLLLTDLTLPWILSTGLGWLGLVLVLPGPAIIGWIFALLLPFLTTLIGLIASADVLRQSKTNLLLRGSVPQPGEVALFAGIVCLAVPLLVLWFMRQYLVLGLPLAVGTAILLVKFVHQIAVDSLRAVK